ncbi:hypothetical protein BGZ96_012225 [Linnemannia gamsii]|uniref:Zn(2)-C6 fungal-type domain-containing protein n=1 Tax=Linnemannia gamsii TaxID=64522 RepID=A0ABQ7JQT3_9FUNG|nr:hypothetical protein BGZ96_012225 [Linnemannia gamsii]
MTFSGLLKSLKHHAATANSAAAATGVHATKPGVVTNTTNTTTTSTTATNEHSTHTQGTVMVSPKTDSTSVPESTPVLSMTPQQSQITSIDPTVLSIDPRSSSSQPQMLSSPLSKQPTVSKLDMKQPVAPTPLSPPSTTPSSPAASIGTITITTTKKKQQQQQQQSLSAAQSASYRKRLNVNQVCDWCRYRKIRCDREAPCNSCQHSKRECIRTPPEVLLSKLNKEAENSSSTEATTTKSTKRVSTADDEQDGQLSSLKAKKVARSSSIAPSPSHISIEHSTPSTFSPDMHPLGLSPPSTSDMSLCGEQQQQPMTMLSSGIQGTQSSLQDQEHLERMRRIEMLLSNVIPGAAEFIAHGHQGCNSFSAPSNEQQEQHHQRQLIMSPISPALAATGSPQGLTLIHDDSSSLSLTQEAHGASIGGEGQQQQQQQEGRRLSFFAGQDYIERMKRIELLLGSVQDKNSITPMTKRSLVVPTFTTNTDIISKTTSNTDTTKKDTTTARKNKATGTKKFARNNDGTIIKRPHVAAGFAGQKPPPKLPQAIAEAALKKLTGKKKKRASASSAASVVAAAAIAVTPVSVASSTTTPSAAPAVTMTVEGASASPASTTTTAAPAQIPSAKTKAQPTAVTLSSPKSFDIPATIDHHQIQENTLQLSFTQQQLQRQHQQKDRAQILVRQQQHGRPGRLNTQLRTSTSYHPRQQHKQQQHALYASSTPTSAPYVGGVGHMTNIGAISIPTIPLSNTMTSYESLVVPACDSAESSPVSSPKTATTTIEFPTISSSVSMPGSTSPLTPMDFLAYGTSSAFPTMHNGVVDGSGGADYSLTMNMIHPTAGNISPIDGAINNHVFLPFTTHGAAPMYSPHHPFQQNRHIHDHHQAMHIPQDTVPLHTSSSEMQAFTGGATALQMTESLESWMNSQLVPSLEVFSTTTTTPVPHTTSAFLAGGGFGRPQQQQQQLQTQQHRPSIQHQHQHQHQQSFYIPQMHDDEDDENEESHE